MNPTPRQTSRFIPWMIGLSLGCLDWSAAWAADIPVSTAAEIASAAKIASPGDTLVMRNGEWRDQEILFRAQGQAEKPITLRAETPGQVLLAGTSVLRISGKHLVVDGLWFKNSQPTADIIEFRTKRDEVAEHCTLRNTAITNCTPADPKHDLRWVSLYGANNVVEKCYFAGKRNKGATMVVWIDPSRPNQHQIRGNFFGPRPALGSNGGETIRVGDSATSLCTSKTLVEGNLFERCNGEVEVISNKSCENVYRANTFRECEGTLTFRHGKACLAEGNFFLGNQKPNTGGVRIIDEDHTVVNNYFAELTGSSARSALTMMNGRENSPLNGYFQVKRALVAFNTFIDCKTTFLLGQPDAGGTLPPADSLIANNVVQGTSAPFVKVVTQPVNLTWESNLMSGASVGIKASGITTDDPRLLEGADGLWRLDEQSPARNAATGDFVKVTVDMDGQARPAKGRDIGADQFSTEATVRRPLNPDDAGPAWRDFLVEEKPQPEVKDTEEEAPKKTTAKTSSTKKKTTAKKPTTKKKTNSSSSKKKKSSSSKKRR